MEQEIRYCELDGRRIAYATVGEGPVLLFGGRWISHLEEDWSDPDARSFFEDLALTHRVVRYDRIGVGLSDRGSHDVPDVRQLGAVLDACGGGPAALFGCSCAGLAMASFARDFPERVSKLVFFGGYAARDDIPDATRGSIIDFVRVNWPLASQMLAGLLVPHASGVEIAAFSRYMRLAADADMAASSLEDDLTTDARAVLPHVTTPALVLHRRGDRAVPIGRGRELASLLPNARFMALSGDAHLPWMDDHRDVRRALSGFLEDGPAAVGRRRQPAQRQGVGGAAARRRRALEPRDRRLALPQRAHGAPARRQHPAQARAVVPRRRGHARDARRLRLSLYPRLKPEASPDG